MLEWLQVSVLEAAAASVLLLGSLQVLGPAWEPVSAALVREEAWAKAYSIGRFPSQMSR